MTNGEKIKEIFPNGVLTSGGNNYCDYESTIKNDLEVECISREQALVAIRSLYPSMPRVDFNGSLRKWVDKYKPYIECDDAIKQLSSVTPIRPKGHWIKEESIYGWDGHSYQCSVCGRSIHLDAIMEDLADYPYCHCGAKMESEEKE